MDRGCILVVEDNPSVLLACAETLKRAGYLVRTEIDGVAGMRALDDENARIRLVLTDLEMPGATGLEVASHSRRVRPDLPLILMSGSLDDRARNAAKPLGLKVLEKPFTMNVLLDSVLDAAGGPSIGSIGTGRKSGEAEARAPRAD
jgi:two-component system cell cycle sensor histidine kinase/response regulator CckA